MGLFAYLVLQISVCALVVLLFNVDVIGSISVGNFINFQNYMDKVPSTSKVKFNLNKRGGLRINMISKKKFTFIILFIFISLFSNLYCEQLIPFENIFKKIKETNIQTEGLDVGYLFMVEIDSYNNFVFLDAKACQVLLFSKEGRFLKRVGKKGQGPGEFIAPSGIALDKQGNIIIADNRMRRINKYDKEGNFLSSFIITGAHWPPNLIYIDSNENFFLGGLKSAFKEKEPETWINKYSSKGKYIKSFFIRNTNQAWLRSIFPFFGFDMDDEDIIYAIQINEYKISVFDSEGNILKTFGKAPYYFKVPDPKLKVNWSKFKTQSEMRDELTKLSKSWTRILHINLVSNKYLLLILEMNNLIKGFDKKYVVDIWDKKGDLIIGGIRTGYKFLCSDKDGYVYFLTYTDEEKVLEKDPEYRIGKFKFTIDSQ